MRIATLATVLLATFYTLVAIPGIKAQTVSSTGYHTLAICPTDSSVWAWGGNFVGSFGDSTKISNPYPVLHRDPIDTGFLKGYTKVLAVGAASFGLKADGSLWAWGAGSAGQLGQGNTSHQYLPIRVKGLNGVGFLDSVIDFCGNYQSIFALRADSSVWGWGWNGTGVLGDGTYFNSRLTPVQTTKYRDTIPMDSVVAIASGAEHGLALAADGTVWAWGWDYSGELGQGLRNTSFSGLKVKSPGFQIPDVLNRVIAISAGYNFSVGLRNDGTVWTWGNNEFGQLGDSSFLSKRRPVQVKDPSGVGPLRNIAAIDCGEDHVLALSFTGEVYAWGSNSQGQLGPDLLGTKSNLPIRVSSFSDVAEVHAGGDVSMVILKNGELRAWGYNGGGNLGNGTYSTFSAYPEYVLNSSGTGKLNNILNIDARDRFTVAQTIRGRIYKWGNNMNNEHLSSNLEEQPFPILLQDTTGANAMRNVKQIAVGNGHGVVLEVGGIVYGFGSCGRRELGNPPFSWRTYPFSVQQFGGGYFTGVQKVDADDGNSAFLLNDSTVRFLGWCNNVGPAYPSSGNGILKDSTGLNDLNNIIDIAISKNNIYALSADSMLWAWGKNDKGQIGDSTSTDKRYVVRVMKPDNSGPLDSMIDVVTAEESVLALRADGTVYGWGFNGAGQNGTGTTDQAFLPRQVVDSSGTKALTNIVAIANGQYHSLALAADSTVWAWGANTYGNLGDGTRTHSRKPIQVLDKETGQALKGVKAIAAGTLYSVFLMTDHKVMACGWKNEGQTGTRKTLGQEVPVQPELICRGMPPVANFASDIDSSCGAVCIQFSDSSLNNPSEWYWSFPGGNPSSSREQNPEICYASPGVYEVELIAKNFVDADSTVMSNYITIHPSAWANAGLDSLICEGIQYQIMANGSGTFKWSPSANLSCSDCPNPSILINASTNLILEVSDSTGCKAFDTLNLGMNPNTISGFSYSIDTINREVSFSNSSAYGKSYHWDFGDGNTDTSLNASHSYANYNDFRVCLISTNDCNSDTLCDTLRLRNTGVQALSRQALLKVFPNPNNGNFSIILNGFTEEGMFEIRDALGKVVKEIPIRSNPVNLSFSEELSAGIYLCRLYSESGVEVRTKFVVTSNP